MFSISNVKRYNYPEVDLGRSWFVLEEMYKIFLRSVVLCFYNTVKVELFLKKCYTVISYHIISFSLFVLFHTIHFIHTIYTELVSRQQVLFLSPDSYAVVLHVVEHNSSVHTPEMSSGYNTHSDQLYLTWFLETTFCNADYL